MGTKLRTIELNYLMTSLSSSKALLQDFLKLSLNHWQIENKLHRSRDSILRKMFVILFCINLSETNLQCLVLAIVFHSSITRTIETVTYNICIALSLLIQEHVMTLHTDLLTNIV